MQKEQNRHIEMLTAVKKSKDDRIRKRHVVLLYPDNYCLQYFKYQ